MAEPTNGIDMESLAGFHQAAEANHDMARVRFRASSRWTASTSSVSFACS